MDRIQRAIIVGASSGIGLALAGILLEKNWCIGITARRENLLKNFQQQAPDKIKIAAFDITHDNVAAKLDELVIQTGGLDLLVISAGYGEENDDLNFAIESGMIDTNVKGFTAVADWAYNYFRHHPPGHIAAITSVAGIRGNRAAPAYFSTKAYQIHYLQSLRHKAKKEKLPLIITDLRPGFVQTKATGKKLFWSSSVNKAAQQIYHSIKNKKRVAYITRRWKIVAMLLHLLPGWLYEKI